MRGARILVCSYRIETRIGSGAKIEEARMSGILTHEGEIDIALTKQSITEHTQITDIKNKILAQLTSYREIDVTGFRIAQIVCNRTDTAKCCAIGGSKTRNRVSR